jgi:tetratricopeptide (TPR) repeat protein
VELKARLAKERGQGPEAAKLLKAEAAKENANLRGIAALLEELAQYDAAEDVWRQYLAQAKEPEAPLGLASFLARRKRTKEALSICENAWKTCKPEVAGMASVAVVHAATAAQQYGKLVSGWIEDAMKKNPQSTALMMQLADLRNLEARYNDSEKLYREVIKREPTQRAALNNLAWILAFQSGRQQEALDLVNQALDTAAPSLDMYDTRGMIYLLMGEFDKAILDFQEALNQPSAGRYLHLAMALHASQQIEAAKDAVKKARELGLDVERLHPRERSAWESMSKELRAG